MKKSPVILLGFAMILAHAAFGQNATTTPVGAMAFTIAAGSGTSAKLTTLSLPLLDTAIADGKMTGKITGVTATTISNSSAGWTAGQLSTAATPCLIRITSGLAAGRTFLISTATSNTGTTITVDGSETVNTPDLTKLGIVADASTGDTYSIVACDTISSVFGAPSLVNSVVGGTTSKGADNIILFYNGGQTTYFYKTDVTPKRWTKVALGNPDASNTPLRPDAGITYSRIGATPINYTLIGSVPNTDRKVVIRNAGVTYLAQSWPIDRTISQLGLHSLSTWIANSNVNNADKIQILINNAWATFWYDGANWKKQALGSPISNNQTVSAGSNVLVNKIGTNSTYSQLSQTLPY